VEAPPEASRIEPALEVPPRPQHPARPILEVPPRLGPLSEPPRQHRRHRAAFRWLVAVALFTVAVLAGLVVAAELVVATWPSAVRLYAVAGLAPEQPGAGLKIDKVTPARAPDGLIIEGDIANIGKAAHDVPQLRVALRDVTEKEVQ